MNEIKTRACSSNWICQKAENGNENDGEKIVLRLVCCFRPPRKSIWGIDNFSYWTRVKEESRWDKYGNFIENGALFLIALFFSTPSLQSPRGKVSQSIRAIWYFLFRWLFRGANWRWGSSIDRHGHEPSCYFRAGLFPLTGGWHRFRKTRSHWSWCQNVQSYLHGSEGLCYDTLDWFFYWTDLRATRASSAPENLGSNSRAFFSSFFAFSFSPFL